MDRISEIVKTGWIITIAFFLIENLTSLTRLKNQMKFLLSMVFITVMLSFFTGIDYNNIDFEQNIWDRNSYETSAELCNNLFKKQISGNIGKVLGEEFEASGIKNSKMEFEINISQTNCIDISKVIINTEQYEAAENIIRKNLGEEVEIINEAE